jgi:hypothetical protein
MLDQRGRALVTAHLCGREFVLAALLLVFLLAPSSVCGQETAFGPLRGPSLWDDFRYLGNSVWEDAKAIALAPLEIGKVREVTTEQLLIGALVVGSVGGMIGLDGKIRDAAKGINDSSALTLQRAGFGLVGGGLLALYGTGWWTDEEQKRHAALTGLESTVVAFGIAELMKVTFGRERPDSGKGPLAWFQGGQSFISGDTTPAFALAEAVAAGFDHRSPLPPISLPQRSEWAAWDGINIGPRTFWRLDSWGAGRPCCLTTCTDTVSKRLRCSVFRPCWRRASSASASMSSTRSRRAMFFNRRS